MRRYLILGNGAAGATAAESARAADPQAEITVVGAERHLMYSRPGLAYVLSGIIPPQQVVARSQGWYRERRIQVVHAAATAVDPAARRVSLAGGRSLPYDRLLIATGARATALPYPGADLDGVVFLDTLDGALDMMRRLKRARRAVVIGGGITALEMAEGFAHRRLETHYVLRRSVLWASVFNEAESCVLEERMRAEGVTIHYNTEAEAIVGDRVGRSDRGKVAGVRLKGGALLPADLVGAGIGVRPQIDLAHGTAIRVDQGVLVDEQLRASAPDVFAAGDCAQVLDRWTGRHTLDVLWPTAVAQGNTAGRNLAGGQEVYTKGVPANACMLFGLHVTAIGQLGGSRDADEPEVVQHLSRGSSEVWSTGPRHYASAWSAQGPNTVRLVLSDDRLVGALIVGEQSLADALRFLIEGGVNLRPLRSLLDRGGPEMSAALQRLYEGLKEGRREPAIAS
jgi:NAD(P)H-nitrite reductase large subunit